MIDDIIRESWVYKEWQQEATKQNIVVVVQARFPSLVELAQERLELLKTPEQLQQFLIQLAQARDEEEARYFLLAEGNEQP